MQFSRVSAMKNGQMLYAVRLDLFSILLTIIIQRYRRILRRNCVGLQDIQKCFSEIQVLRQMNALSSFARKYSFDKYGKGRHNIITLVNSFHGRTLCTLSATGQDSFHNYFSHSLKAL